MALPVYDEQEAIRYILEHIPEQDKQNLTEDTVGDVLDFVDDFYEQSDLYNEETETALEGEVDESDLLQFVLDKVEEEHLQLSYEQVQLILTFEFEYGCSIGVYEE
ncbi:MAG: hypothetical protein IJ756_06765 [Paludibacteraceae bacterium]|nr:hypothetical protein [Paludibacteraceae bacterium]MBR1786840.1 hypothetical protein [Paludibacteraceae bacterium]